MEDVLQLSHLVLLVNVEVVVGGARLVVRAAHVLAVNLDHDDVVEASQLALSGQPGSDDIRLNSTLDYRNKDLSVLKDVIHWCTNYEKDPTIPRTTSIMAKALLTAKPQ